MKKLFKILLKLIIVLLIVVVCYLAYVFFSYHRIEDNLSLEVSSPSETTSEALLTGKEYEILTWNIGYGAYESDYTFFMDGGVQSWAWSKERLETNLQNIKAFLSSTSVDFAILQEVDFDATRTYHFDERVYLTEAFPSYYSVFAQNYDSPFLFYPLYQPHGKSRSGIMTFSEFPISSALRRQFPLEKGVRVILDLDRCFSISRIPVSGGRELVLINMHMSAFTADGQIAVDQLEMVISFMQQEYEKGNWVIAGGDFNKDLTGLGSSPFGVESEPYSWSQPIPMSVFEGTNISLVAAFDEENPVPSVRNVNEPYSPSIYQVTVDGFLVSENIQVTGSEVIDLSFSYSDHNPVKMSFILK